jgi:hypothetical protein
MNILRVLSQKLDLVLIGLGVVAALCAFGAAFGVHF